MTTVLTVLGAVAILLFGTIFVLIILLYLSESQNHFVQTVTRDTKENALKELGYRLEGQCYWFSENPEVMLAVKIIGEDLMRRGCFDVSDVRDRWRKDVLREKVEKTIGGSSMKFVKVEDDYGYHYYKCGIFCIFFDIVEEKWELEKFENGSYHTVGYFNTLEEAQRAARSKV